MQDKATLKNNLLGMAAALMLLAAGCGGAPAATPTPTVPAATSVPPTSTPVPPAALDYGNLPTSPGLNGLPRLGFENAPVSVAVYIALDDAASAQFFINSFPTLLARARGSEILLTGLPLLKVEGSTDARGAARAALCAGEQGYFFQYVAQLFAWYSEFGDSAYSGSRLVEGIGLLDIDMGAWNACMVTARPDEAIGEAARLFAELPYGGNLPLVTVGSDASLPDPESLNFTIDRALLQLNVALNQSLVESTAEATPEVIEIDPLTGDRTIPPLDISLPEGWRAGYDTMIVQDVDMLRAIPLAIYTGPVTGGTGTIVLLWAFPNVATQTDNGSFTTDLWLDGLRLLRLVLIEEGCNIGTDLRREYSVGGLAAVGTAFSAVDCPELPDTRGWFAGLEQQGLNYVFFTYAEPIDAMNGAEAELQGILDSIVFQALPEPEATEVSP